MATYTENYNLIKPGAEDYYDVEDFNNNMDTLDGVMAAAANELEGVSGKMDTAQNSIDSISSKIGTPPSGQSLVSMLQSGGSVIRSTQRVSLLNSEGTQSTVTIQPVNPAKCFMFSERLKNDYQTLSDYDYTLTSTAIHVTHTWMVANALHLGFWIVEFV